MHHAYTHKFGKQLKVNQTEKMHFGHTSTIVKHDLGAKEFEKHLVMASKHNIKSDYEEQHNNVKLMTELAKIHKYDDVYRTKKITCQNLKDRAPGAENSDSWHFLPIHTG